MDQSENQLQSLATTANVPRAISSLFFSTSSFLRFQVPHLKWEAKSLRGNTKSIDTRWMDVSQRLKLEELVSEAEDEEATGEGAEDTLPEPI